MHMVFKGSLPTSRQTPPSHSMSSCSVFVVLAIPTATPTALLMALAIPIALELAVAPVQMRRSWLTDMHMESLPGTK